jgi:hypothetical protein
MQDVSASRFGKPFEINIKRGSLKSAKLNNPLRLLKCVCYLEIEIYKLLVAFPAAAAQ